MHACISNGYPNLWSNFNSGNLVKSETPSCGFAKVWLKGGKKSSELNITKFGMHSYLPNAHLNIWSYFNSKKLVKQKTLSCAFTKVALKGSEIAWNVAKVSVYTCLLKWVPKSTFKFHFWKSQQKCIFSPFVWPSLNEGQNRSKSHKNRCPCLSLKWVSKSTLKFEFWEI